MHFGKRTGYIKLAAIKYGKIISSKTAQTTIGLVSLARLAARVTMNAQIFSEYRS